MKIAKIIFALVCIIIGFYWLANNPYSFNNKQFKLADGRDVICSDSISNARVQAKFLLTVDCYDVSSDFIPSQSLGGKMPTLTSSKIQALSWKYSLLKSLGAIILALGISLTINVVRPKIKSFQASISSKHDKVATRIFWYLIALFIVGGLFTLIMFIM